METTTKAGIGSLLAGFSGLVAFIVNWIVTKQTPTPEAFSALGAALGASVAAGIGLIKATDHK